MNFILINPEPEDSPDYTVRIPEPIRMLKLVKGLPNLYRKDFPTLIPKLIKRINAIYTDR